jgi:hypothetical protein
MSKLFKLLGFLVMWGGSLSVLYINHVVLVEGAELDTFGFLVTLVIIFTFIKWVDGKVKVWEIQDKYTIFRLCWTNGKRILIAGLGTWLLYVVEDNITKLQTSALLITSCFVIGFVLILLGNLKIKKGTH